jgi:deazaflavin-dependent oxidoreductase (nitroreductase family)
MAQHDRDPLAGEYVPGSSEMAREQVALYEATGGEEGRTLEELPVVILTMIGATSGKVRKTPLMRVEHDGSYFAVASAGGAPKHPAWYYNLIAHPDVRLQDGARVLSLRAREVFGQEKAEAWKVADSCWPYFPEYRATSGREIPVMVLEPVKSTP